MPVHTKRRLREETSRARPGALVPLKVASTERPSARVAVACAALAAASLMGAGGRSANEWLERGADTRGSLVNPVACSEATNEYALRLFHVVPEGRYYTAGQRVFACDLDGEPGAEVFLTHHASRNPRADHHAESLRFGETVSIDSLFGGLVLAARRIRGDLRMLVWECDVTTARRSRERRSPSEMFVENYAHASMNDDDTDFDLSASAASRGDELRVYGRVSLVSPFGSTLGRIELPDSRNPRGADFIAIDGAEAALVYTNSGFPSNAYAYLLLEHQRLRGGTVELGSALTRRYAAHRGVAAYDPVNGETIWEKQTGTYFLGCTSADLNADGLTEILPYALSPTNAVSADGTTDYLCNYAICLDERGNELWRHRSVGPYLACHTAVGDVNGSPGLETVAAFSSPQNDRAGELVVVAADGELLARRTDGAGFSGVGIADLRSNGKEEVVAGGSLGRVYMFDGSLEVLASFTDTAHAAFNDRRTRPLALNDIDGDGETEVVALSSGWTRVKWGAITKSGHCLTDTLAYVVVLGPSLEEETRCVLPWPRPFLPLFKGGGTPGQALVVDTDGNGMNEVVVLRAAAGLFVYTVAPASPRKYDEAARG